jgi:hypothetical protein
MFRCSQYVTALATLEESFGMSMPQRYLSGLLAVTMLIGIIGCASPPSAPPGLQDGQYTNGVYQYSVAIPPGWTAHEQAPINIARLMGEELTDVTSLVLVNRSGGGVIAVLNLSDEGHFNTYVNTPEGAWEQLLPALEEQMGTKGEVIESYHELYPDSLARTLRNRDAGPLAFKPQALLTAEFDMRYTDGDSKSRIRWYLYPCRGNETCQAIFLLACNQDRYEANRPAFDVVVSSLTIHAAVNE